MPVRLEPGKITRITASPLPSVFIGVHPWLLNSCLGIRAEVQRNKETEQHEREKLVLRLENALLRFERLLPPAKAQKRRK